MLAAATRLTATASRRSRSARWRSPLAHYTEVRFRLVHVTLDLWLPFRALGLGMLANRWPEPYEKYLAFRFPAMNIRAQFEALKQPATERLRR